MPKRDDGSHEESVGRRLRQRKKTIDYQEEEVPDRDEYICECENDRMTFP